MRIGSYEVLLELARGGMGKVYLARTMGPGGIERLVAIKRAHEHLLVASRAVADRFLDEARIAALVHHSSRSPDSSWVSPSTKAKDGSTPIGTPPSSNMRSFPCLTTTGGLCPALQYKKEPSGARIP